MLDWNDIALIFQLMSIAYMLSVSLKLRKVLKRLTEELDAAKEAGKAAATALERARHLATQARGYEIMADAYLKVATEKLTRRKEG